MVYSRLGCRCLGQALNARVGVRPVSRCMSSATDRVLVVKDEKSGVVTMKLNRPPVNSLSLEFLTDINIALEKLENDKSVRGLILTSNTDKVFSAGVDIFTEYYHPTRERLTEFWRTLQDVWMSLYGSHLPTIAAINGHSIAGGSLLSMCCDYRIMASNFKIGLNETQLGLSPPFWLVNTMARLCGPRLTAKSCQNGLLFTTEQAKTAGLIDDIAPLDTIQDAARQEMKSWLKIPDAARQITKAGLRQPHIDELMLRREEDISRKVNHVMQDSIQEALGAYMDTLKEKKNK